MIRAKAARGPHAGGFAGLYKIKRVKVARVGHRRWRTAIPRAQEPTLAPTSHHPNAGAALPPPIAEYVEATNSFDLERLLATFADDALVNDQLRDYWGLTAIKGWATRDIIGEKLTMNVVEVIEHYNNYIVTANIDGNFDKRGLPDPLVLAFYFTPHRDRIVQLIILRNRHDI